MILDIYLRVFLSKMLKVCPSLSLLLIVKCERRDEWKRKCVSQREAKLEGFENSQPIQVLYSINRVENVAGGEFSEEIRQMNH